MSIDQFLNHTLCSRIDMQTAALDLVAATAVQGDSAGARGVVSVERWVLPSCPGRVHDFAVVVHPPCVHTTRDELRVDVSVVANHVAPGQLARWRTSRELHHVWYMLNGQLAAAVRPLDGYLDVWHPGRMTRTRRVTDQQFDYEQRGQTIRARDANVTLPPIDAVHTAIDAAWEEQSATAHARLDREAASRGRRFVFAHRNPIIRLTGSAAPTVLRITAPNCRFTGLLLRETPLVKRELQSVDPAPRTRRKPNPNQIH